MDHGKTTLTAAITKVLLKLFFVFQCLFKCVLRQRGFGVYCSIGFDQVLADEGKAKAVAFDEIDKAPEEKKRGITIATVRTCSFGHTLLVLESIMFFSVDVYACLTLQFSGTCSNSTFSLTT